MKKLVVTTILGIAASLSCLAQGNFTFNNNAGSAVWDNRSGVGIKAAATMEVAMMWSANLTATNPVRYLVGNEFSPTNGAGQFGDWSGIFTDPNWQLAHDTSGGNPVIVNTAGGVAPFAGIFTGGIKGLFGSSANQTILLYVLAWDKSFGIDPIAASQAGAPMGFSRVLQYTLGNNIVPGGGIGNGGLSPMGVNVLIPEPATFALLGLGAAGLLIFRRRK
jgi:hypothetical protein